MARADRRLARLAAALLLDAAIGDPAPLIRAVGHPVSWAGALIAWLDRRLNRGPDRVRARGGVVVMLCLLGAATGAARLASRAGRVAVVLAAASLLAQNGLAAHVRAVADAPDLAARRRAVGRIVGREVAALDEAGVARAAIESLAENFSDGVVAPALWFALAGLPGIAAYKAVNTADSMIGHRTARHLRFGAAAARLDDLLNLAPARLSALLIALAAPSPARAIATARRDARRHRSPNAGWPEAAMAGGLGLRLGGPRAYHGTPAEEPWIGDGRDPDAADIRAAIRVAWRAWTILLLATVLGAAPSLTRRRARPPSS